MPGSIQTMLQDMVYIKDSSTTADSRACTATILGQLVFALPTRLEVIGRLLTEHLLDFSAGPKSAKVRDEAALALAYLSTKDATMAATIVESVSSKSKNFELTETLTAAIDSAVWLKEPMAAGSSAGVDESK